MTKSKGNRVPSREECDELMAQYSMLPNIVAHSRQVMNVSLAIIDNLKNGITVNRGQVIAAALLHDITKTKSLKTKETHAATGGALLRELGFQSIAEIVEQHVVIENLDPKGRIEEREIVYYADKRVMHDTIVTVEERVNDLIRRYGTTEKIRYQILQNKTKALLIEKKIASFMAIDLHLAIR
ncbi:MAG: HDIG domain-containing protein [Syntrophales bacterium LBB04]|nr:HDIG domain-containing protein [Syntrophales bacterium LBB04]